MSDTSEGLTHLDSRGHPRMMDVSGKPESQRTAVARGRIVMQRSTLDAVLSGETPKGSVLAAGELAGIMAGKRTGELIPLCHILPAVSLGVVLTPDPDLPGIRARATARIAGSTGVEMEALTAVSLSLLTVYDMTKALDWTMRIEGIELESKEGGRSGPRTAGIPRPESGSGAAPSG